MQMSYHTLRYTEAVFVCNFGVEVRGKQRLYAVRFDGAARGQQRPSGAARNRSPVQIFESEADARARTPLFEQQIKLNCVNHSAHHSVKQKPTPKPHPPTPPTPHLICI